jgi:hypothetical protein
MTRTTRTVLAAGALLAVQTSAQAHVPAARARDDAKETKVDHYGYVFPDDPMAANPLGPNDPILRVTIHPLRMTLIRPRTSFVTEMLESVEKL